MSAEDSTALAVSLDYRLEGLDCADCAQRLERQIQRLPGVEQAQVNYGAGRLTVTGAALESSAIEQAVARAGYAAIPEGDTGPAVPGRDAQGQSRRSLTRSFWLARPNGRAAAMSLAFAAAGMAASRLGASPAAFIALFITSIVTGGYLIARSAYRSLLQGVMDMDVLTIVAAIGAGVLGQWEEGAAVVALFALGNALESLSMEKARGSVRSLLEEAPDEALVITPVGLERRPTRQVAVGDVCLVRPGQRLPVDGVVLAGRSAVNEASVTGEAVPADKEPGSQVYAGTINTFGALEVRTARAAGDSTLARIVRLVEQSQAARAPSERFVSRFARVYTPVVIALAAALAIVPPLFVGHFTTWFYRALGLLIVACPCALVLSTPVTVVSALGNAARHGVLIKGGAHLERLGQVTHLALDKTGTLTRGQPEVVRVVAAPGWTSREVLALGASLEHPSEHPLARAVLAAAQAENLALQPVEGFEALPGKGAVGRLEGRLCRIGSPAFQVEALGMARLPALSAEADQLESQGMTVLVLSRDAEIVGLLALADQLRPEARGLLDSLHRAGMTQLVLLTGDTRQAADLAARQAGLDRVQARLLPEDKARAVEALRQEGVVAMVGDGINDAPALAAADVGIAMGGAGSDTALEVADVVLMGDDLRHLPYAVRLGRLALAVIRQNVAIALGIKLLALLMIIPGWLNLWMAVFADSGASLIVIANGMRLLAVKDQPVRAA
ncbi:MAG: heavy metal translocating P-type ATPase [Bacillota bacterium]